MALSPLVFVAALSARAAPSIDEGWTGASPPVVGEGGPALTVVLRGASEAQPVTARIGAVEGQLQHLGLAVFAVSLRGVPEQGELRLFVGEEEAWTGEVQGGEHALLLLNSRGKRIERLPAAPELPAEPLPRSPVLPVAWLALCLVALGLAARR